MIDTKIRWSTKMHNKLFTKRSGTTDEGKDYEHYIIANFAFHLATDSTIKNFTISSNDDNFGAFDDIVLETETSSSSEKYAIQLKHVTNKEFLSLRSLTEDKGKGGFSLKKYFKSFQEHKQTFSGYKLILFTNLKLNVGSDTTLSLNVDGKAHPVRIVNSRPGTTLKNVVNETCYKFEIENTTVSEKISEYKKFFEVFSLYTNQANVNKLKNVVPEEIKAYFSKCDEAVPDKYIKFITDWSMQTGLKKKLNKSSLQEVVAMFLLNRYIHPICFGTVNENAKLLQKACSNFDVTIFKEELVEEARRLWGDAKDQLIDIKEIRQIIKQYQFKVYDIDKMSDEQCTKLLWAMNKCPLIVKESKKTCEVIKFCKNKKFVVLRKNVPDDVLNELSLFQQLSDLSGDDLYQKVTKKFMCSVLSGNEIELEQLLHQDVEIRNSVTTNELLKMVDGPYNIEVEEEVLPSPYIHRFISRIIIDLRYLKAVSEDTLVVLSNVKNFHSWNNLGTNMYIFKHELSQDEFAQLCEHDDKMKRYHHFRVDGEVLEWMKSIGDISDIERFRLDRYFAQEESLLMSHYNNNVQIISDEPGIGKSVLLQSLKNSYSSQFWTIILSQNDISKLQLNENFEESILGLKFPYATDFEKSVLKLQMQNGRFLYMWDGLDQFDDDDIETVTDFIRSICQNKSIHWITCRQHLKKYLEQKLCALSKHIQQFSDHQQIVYIKERLKNTFREELIDSVITKIKNSFGMTKSIDLLGVPIQMYMLTELFRRDSQKYFLMLNSLFPLSKLYEYFVEEKLNDRFKKTKGERRSYHIVEGFFGNYKKILIHNYQEVALIVLFEQELLEELHIDRWKVLAQNQQQPDFGFVKKGNNVDEKPLFVHVSYAEYFAACYFAREYPKIFKLNTILFNPKYTNIRFFFDMILANNSIAHIAVLYKSYEVLMRCENLRGRDEGGRTVLHLACSWGKRYPQLKVSKKTNSYILDDETDFPTEIGTSEYRNILEYLLRRFNFREPDRIFHMSALSYAEKAESLVAVLTIEQKYQLGYFESKPFDYVCSSLYYSVRFGYHAAIDLFRDVRFIETTSGSSLLHLAVEQRQLTCLDKLLTFRKFARNINFERMGTTSLFLACMYGYADIVEILVKAGAEDKTLQNMSSNPLPMITAVNQNVWTPIHVAALFGLENIVQHLIKSKVEINAVDINNNTPLNLACFKQHEKVVALLLKSGSDYNIANANGSTPLHLSSNNNNFELVRMLVNAGSFVDVADDHGWTPLHVACYKGNVKIARHLIKFEANVNSCDNDGWTPLHSAACKGHNNIVDLLIKKGAEFTTYNNNGWTPFHSSCQGGYLEVAKSLTKAGASVDVNSDHGWTPLHLASRNGYLHLVELLLTQYAHVNAVNENGWTPLHLAAQSGHCFIASLLITCGANINAACKSGLTPLHTSAHHGHFHVSELLVCRKADVNAKTKNGLTALEIAIKRRHKKIVKLLINNNSDIDSGSSTGLKRLHVSSRNTNSYI